jgi:KUP system potassium uptake protein
VSETVTTTAPGPAEPPGQAAEARAAHAAGAGLVLAALGVVFGDIGTSPLYALQTVFNIDHGAVRPTSADVYGVVSLVFWSVTLIVSVKYVTVLMRADNDGEGGVMALAALVQRVLGGRRRRAGVVILLAILGASLFYGDSVITPAISVLSAVEGLKVAAPSLSHLVLPLATTILAILFIAQRWGTGRVGAFFGPVMVVWFSVLALAGLREVVPHPGILRGLSPSYAASFLVSHPVTSFVALGAVVLCITGAEALYADMGHFGRPPIRRAWFAIVFPALTLNYLGQSALILQHRTATANPFFLLLPSWARVPMVILATAATVIASQAVISGAFSVSRQAAQLGLLPPLRVRQTSEHTAGQVYLPAVNWALFVGVLALILTFRSSARLATAYGIAVTGALLIDSVLLLLVARLMWRWPTWRLVLAAVAFAGTEIMFLSANLTKVAHGGWLPLLIATGVFLLMTTWRRGREVVVANRTAKEGSLETFIEQLDDQRLTRVPGTAVFPHPRKDTTPLALRANVEHNHVLHQLVVIVSALVQNTPHVNADQRLVVDNLGHADDGIIHLTVRHGFSEPPDIPGALVHAAATDQIEGNLDLEQASYFVSRGAIQRTRARGMSRWRKALFVTLAHNAADPADRLGLPPDRTVVMGSHIDI